MKRTYQLTIEMPDSFNDVPDWKVETLIAKEIEKARISRDGFPAEQPLKVSKINHIETVLERPYDTLEGVIGAFFGTTSWMK